MPWSLNGAKRINSFALVTYMPDPLRGFLDNLRQELVTSCRIQSHVTLLPPRPISGSPELAWSQAESRLREVSPFRVGLGDVEIFPVTNVIYLGVTEGRDPLISLHRDLNTQYLAFQEPHQYHPHLTLAQTLEEHQVDGTLALARRRWAEYDHPRSFLVEKLTFVQNTEDNQWIDLASCTLSEHAIVGER
jgi:2'-5' RNA ligase